MYYHDVGRGYLLLEIKDIVLLQKPEGIWSSVQGVVPTLSGMTWIALSDEVKAAFERDLRDFNGAD